MQKKLRKKKSTKILNSQVEDMMRDYFEQITITRNLAKVIVNVLDAGLKKKSQPKKRQDLKKLNDKFMKNTLSGSINFSDFRDISNNLNKINNNVFFSKFNIEIFKKIFFSQKSRKIYGNK